MTLIVEDGTGLTTSESYISVDNAKLYVNQFYGASHSFLSSSDTQIEQYLRRASQWMEGKYENRWKGYRTDEAQSLAWPRNAVEEPLKQAYLVDAAYPQTILGRAQTEIAIRIQSGVDINPDLSRGGQIKREKVDVLEVEYMDGAPAGFTIPQVDELLARYLRPGKNHLGLVRS